MSFVLRVADTPAGCGKVIVLWSVNFFVGG